MMRIEDYGLIGDTQTAALVGRNGSIDWLCLPGFDGGACFAALLGNADHGHWQIAPASAAFASSRRYRGHTAVLETTFESADARLTVIDFMPLRDPARDPVRGLVRDPEAIRVDLVRIVRCDRGRVDVHSRLVLRFDYGSVVPWVRRCDDGISAIAGPDAVRIRADVALVGKDLTTQADFALAAGEQRSFTLTWHPSHWSSPAALDSDAALRRTERAWHDWIGQANGFEHCSDPQLRSLITLKVMTFSPTGAIVAAPTTSLPERIGGERNWDYRFCWIRDSTLTLYALLASGFVAEARDWRRWLLRAAAGDPSKLQIMYGLRGERRLPELTLPWLPGYEASVPVRIGNAAHAQVQLDVYGELLDTLHVARKFKLEASEDAWQLQKALVRFIAENWREPDRGIWEIRGEPRHFTHSKAMAWVAIDRAVRSVEMFGLDGPVDRWRELCAEIRDDVYRHGVSARHGGFTQSYGEDTVDASLLLLAQVGFVAPDDRRYLATVTQIERELKVDGMVLRYRTDTTDDGLAGGEGAFIACSFWLVDAYVQIGRYDDARALFDRLLALRNDLGLLAEEYDPVARRQLGNFPQAFSHIALINAANNLMAKREAPAEDRPDRDQRDRRHRGDRGDSGDSGDSDQTRAP